MNTKDFHALAARVVEQEVSLGVLRGYLAVLLSAEAERCGLPNSSRQDALLEINKQEQKTLADYLANLEDRDPSIAALLDQRNPKDVPTD